MFFLLNRYVIRSNGKTIVAYVKFMKENENNQQF